MGKWIRWQGVAAFAVVCIGLAALWWLVMDRLIERAIEKAGTAAVGAKVELDKADLTLFPLGLALTRLQITDPDEPMTNAIEIGRIAGAVDGLNLLRRKVIIEEMAMEGVRFGTARRTSGAISEGPAKKAVEGRTGRGASVFPDLSLRDPKEILAGDAAAAVVAATDPVVANELQRVFESGLFRVYTNPDVIGCELAGALKNVIAIPSGLADGPGTGGNTRAAAARPSTNSRARVERVWPSRVMSR